MDIKATVQLTTKQMYGFLMKHTYSTTSGFIGVVLSIGGYIGFFYMLQMENASILYLASLLVTGLLFTVIQPLSIYARAKKQVAKNEAINSPLEYVINKSGISVTQGEKSGFSQWDDIVKIVSTKSLVMLYTSRVHAYVIPKESIGDQMDHLKAVVRECCQAGYIKL